MPLEQVEKLAQLGCTQIEMADFFEIDISNLERRLQRPEYRTAYNRGIANLKISLRRKQVEMALAGNPAMCIWLGKQLLGQKERHDFRITDGSSIESGGSAIELLRSRIAELVERGDEGTDIRPANGTGSNGHTLQLGLLGPAKPETP